jgi:hypothetical protein
MTDWQKEIETKIKELEKVPDRNILKVQSARSNFIHAASKAKSDSLLPATRHKWWNSITRKKESFKMNIATLIVILSLLFGGSGATAVAAQASLPGDFLYPVKILSEDVRLELANQPESQVKLALKFAASRFEEIQSLIEAGLMPPDPTVVRWHNQIRIALEEALVSEDQTVQLLMVQEMLQQQLQKMNYLAVDPAVQAWMNQFQFQFQNQLQMVNAGLNEPQKLQQELKWMNQFMNNLETEGQIYQWQQMFQNQAMGEDSQYLWQFQNAHQNQQGINEDETGQNQNENPVEDPGFNNGATDPGENGNGEAQGSNAGTNTNGNGQNGGSGGK